MKTNVISSTRMKIDPKQLMTIPEVAKERGTTNAAIYQLITKGRLKETTIHGRKFVLRTDLANLTLSKAGGDRRKGREAAPDPTP